MGFGYSTDRAARSDSSETAGMRSTADRSGAESIGLQWPTRFRSPSGRFRNAAVVPTAAVPERRPAGCGRYCPARIGPVSGRSSLHGLVASGRGTVRALSAQRSPRHRRPRCRGTGRSTQAWSVPIRAERPEGSWSACRSASPWFVAGNACRRRMDPIPPPPPIVLRSSRTAGLRRAGTGAAGLERENPLASASPSRSMPQPSYVSARSFRTEPAAASFAG